MGNPKRIQRLEAGIAWAEKAQTEAQRRKREAGEPRNPAKAREGQEAAFAAAGDDAHYLGLILQELRAARRDLGPADRGGLWAALGEGVLTFLVCFFCLGLGGLAYIGVALLAHNLGVPVWAPPAALGALALGAAAWTYFRQR